MKLTTIAYSEPEPEEFEILEEPEELTLDSIELYYIDFNTGAKSLMDEPVSIEANDGTEMLTAKVAVGGVNTSEQIDKLVDEGLLEKVVKFVNRDHRLNIDVNSLILNELSEGLISFIVSPNTHMAASQRMISVAKSESKVKDQRKIDKVCKDFFSQFSIGKDLSDFNVNSANQTLYELLEKEAVHLSSIEKKNVIRHIRMRLAEHNISLIYLEDRQ